MKYELTEQPINITETEIDANSYSATITIFIKTTDGISPSFNKQIEVISTNAMTGFEVDEQRNKAVNDYILEINK
jgi:hypothetical protein